MNGEDPQTIVASIEALRAEVVEMKALVRDVLAALGKLDASTSDAAAKITAAIQRWT